MTTTILAAAFCCVLLYAVRALSTNKSRSLLDVNVYRSLDQLALRFDEMYRNVFDPKALTFLRENAPAYAITSYRVRQQQLAQFSLRVVTDTVFRSLASLGGPDSGLSIRHAVEISLFKARAGFLLLICFIGRVRTLDFGMLELCHFSARSSLVTRQSFVRNWGDRPLRLT